MAFTYINNLLKGAVVTFGCLVGCTYQSAPDLFDAAGFWLLAAILCSLGVGLGAMAGVLRSDRMLILLATTFGLMLAPLVAASGLYGHVHWNPDVNFAIHPWLVVGSVVLAWWTRGPRPANVVPAARTRAFRLIPRRLTAVESSTLLWVASAIVIVLGGDRVQEPDPDLYPPLLELDLLPTLGATLVVAIPLGVGVGVVARSMPEHRIASLLMVSGVAAGYGALGLVNMLETFEPASWSPLVIVAATLVLERTTRRDLQPFGVAR